MGTNTLSSVAGGVIRTSHPNQYYTAMTGTIVPRASGSGAPSDNVESCGSSTFRFSSVYAGTSFVAGNSTTGSILGSSTLQMGTIASNTILDMTSNQFAFKTSNTTRALITSSGFRRQDISANNYNISSGSGSYTTSSSSYTLVTNLSISLTTTGRPVIVYLFPTTSSANSTGWGAGSAFEVRRDSTVISSADMTNHPYIIPPCLDVPAAGTYTYALFVKTSAGTINFRDYKIFAMEMA